MHIDGKKTKHVNGMHELSCNLKAVSAILRKGVSAMQLKWNNGHTRSGIELRFGLGLGSGLYERFWITVHGNSNREA